MRHRRSPTAFLVGCVIPVGLAIGCGSGSQPDTAIAGVNSDNLQRLANLYLTYQMDHDWRGPTDEAEFKAFLNAYSPRKLKRIGIDPAAIDDLFVSGRDGEPFKVRYGVRGSAMGSSEPVVFESVGVSGKRRVGFLDMVQREVEEAEYNDLWDGKARTDGAGAQQGRPR